MFSDHQTLSVCLKTAHPQQLAGSVLRIIADDQQAPADFPLGLRSVPTGGPRRTSGAHPVPPPPAAAPSQSLSRDRTRLRGRAMAVGGAARSG
nr:hypothetical protein [Streptomyces sp. Termitarium-T10T-6]